MLLALEIILTIAAWRRGWKGWALVPLGIGLLVGIVFGAFVAGSGGSTQDAMAVGLIGDVAVIVSLIVMIARSREEASYMESRSDAQQPGSVLQEGH